MRNLEEADRPSGASEIDSRLVWGALGVIAVGAVVCASKVMTFRSLRYSDEDRPPIIVRGGSLYFISGDAHHSKNEFKYGKPWKYRKQKKVWQPDHERGKRVTVFGVDVYPPDHSESSPKLPVTYKTESLLVVQDTESFMVTIQDGPGNSPRTAAISGRLKEKDDAPKDNPTLIRQPRTGPKEEFRGIDSVAFTTMEGKLVSETNPALIMIWQW